VQLKHSPFSHFAAISIVDNRFKHGAGAGAVGVDDDLGKAGDFTGVEKGDTLASGEHASMPSVIARHYSYVQASAMASSKVVGFSNSTSVHRGLCSPAVKMLI
jgi:hypothetical protein